MPRWLRIPVGPLPATLGRRPFSPYRMPVDALASEHPTSDESPMSNEIRHILAIIDTATEIGCAVDGLVHGGFLEAEVELTRGTEEAGPRGVADLLNLLAQGLGHRHAGAEMKQRYEEALGDGSAVLAVLVRTEERKKVAARVLHECGAHFINYFGPSSIERIAR